MADPFIPEVDPNLQVAQEEEQPVEQPSKSFLEINSLFAEPSDTGSSQEINNLFSQPSNNLAQAQNLISVRDNPKSVDIIGGLATRLKEGKLPFNKQSFSDLQDNISKYSLEANPKLMEAEKKGDWLGMTKLSLGGVGKVLGATFQAGLGITNEEAEITSNSFAARNYIGTIKDPDQAAKALELGPLYGDELASGKSIVPKDEQPAMVFGKGPFTVKLGMNLAMAENYLRDLESDKAKKLGTASLRNFAIQSGDAFLPFVSIGDIVVDENNPDLVARRSALSNSINDLIQKDYMGGTLAGAAIGSVGSFITVGGAATKVLGRAAQIGSQSIKVPTVLSRGATYATIGASQSFEGDPRDLSVAQRLSSIFSEGAVLGLAEGAGNKLEESIDAALANHAAAKAFATKLPALAPLVGSTGKVVGTTLGETASEEIEAILRGQDPVEPLLQNLAVSGGIGLGMALPGFTKSSFAARRSKIYAMADDRFAETIEKTVANIKSDSNLDDEQKARQLNEFRLSLPSPKAQTLFDAVNVRSSIDRTTSPKSAEVADEAVASSKQNSVESMLSAKLTEAEGQIGTPTVISAEAPETEEEKLSALNELVDAFNKGATSIALSNVPANASKIQWLEGQGRIVGELSEDGKTYSVTNVKTGNGDWLNGTPAIEFNQDLKYQLRMRGEEIGIEEADLDEMDLELEKAGTDLDIEEVARKYLGPTDYELALETKLAGSQELIAEEKPAEINAQKLQAQINVLESKIKEVPEEDKVVLQEQIDKLKAMSVEGQAARLVRGEESVSSLVKQFESEAASEAKAGKLAPELEASPDVILPINNPESESYQKYQKLQPDPRENNREALGAVFNLKNPATVELLQSLGAIDENGRNIMTPAETVLAYTNRKKSYLQSKSLAGYQKYNISDEVSSATINSFLYELRKGKSDISLSILFNSRLRDFIRRAIPRMRAGVGLGAAVSLETPGLRVGAVDAETLAEELGINPAVAGAINEALDQIDATEVDNQLQNPSDIPSQSQRQEALAILGQNLVTPFRESLATEGEKLAFDSVTSGKAATAQDAAKVGTTIENINALKSAVKLKFITALEAEYRKNQQAGTLPSREVAEPEGLVRAGNLTRQQIKPYEDLLKKYISEDMFDDAELANAKALLDQVYNTRAVALLRALETNLKDIGDKISAEGITALAEAIDGEVKAGVEEKSLSEKQGQDYISKLNKLAEPYLASQVMEEGEAKDKIAINFRSNLLTISEQIAKDRGFIIPEGETNEQPISNPEAKTTDDRRAKAREDFPQNESKRASAANRIPGQTIPPQGKEVGRVTTGATVGAGRPGVEIARGTPVPKSFVESRAQVGKVYDEKILAPIGSEALNLLSPEQKQDTAAAITSIEGSSSKSFYLANGPGTGKTRVLLAAGKYYLDKGFNVFLLTAPDAITPDWDQGTIGGTITKDAALMGVPIVARGGKGNNNRGLPIEKVPGKIVVSTYTSQYLEQIIPLVDSKTVVIFDEQHSGRNLHKAVQEGKTRAWAILMNEISLKAGRVLMASGTPFETPDQLLSLGRLGIFNSESPDALIKRLGFEKQYLRGGKKSYWVLSPGVTETEMQDKLETYLDGLVKNGILRSRSLKLDGVKVEFQDVPLDAAITKRLEDIKSMYGGEQNKSTSALRQLVAAQKRALEEYKVNAAAARAIKSIRQGRKPVIYVGFVSETNARGESVDPTSAAVEAELLRLNPNLKIAKMYSGSGQTKEEALAAFNEGDADVLIATKEMGGTGIELDDKFGDQPRDMIVMSSPVSAIQAVQLIYRVWRGDSASRPNLIFLESKAEVDQYNIDRMRAKLRLLDATTSAGFEGLKAEETVTKVVAPVASDEATPVQIAETEGTLQSVLGTTLSNNVITLRDEKGKAKNYNISINPGAKNLAAAMPGDNDESDTIIFNPDKLADVKKLLSPEAFKSYLVKIILEETIHVETFRYFRELGLPPFEEISAIGEGLSQAARLAIARLYYSNFGSDITNPATQSLIKTLANDPYLVAMEGIRQLAQLDLTGGVTEQVVSGNRADIDRATNRLKDIIKDENKSTIKRISIWLDGMATVIKRGLGLAPSAKDRLALRPSIEDSINRLRKTSKALEEASNISPAGAPAPGTSPTAPRPATVFDSYDLRVYRMIENYLQGNTGEVLGVTAADDLFKTIKVSDWLDALDVNTRRGAITNDERSLFRAATQAVMEGGRASLPAIANKAMEIAEGMEEAGKSLPVAAFVATSAPVEVVNASQSFEEEPTYREYRVKIPGSTAISTTAVSEAKAVSNAAIRLFERQEVVNYNGGRYTNPGALIAALRDTGYAKFAKVTSPAPEVARVAPALLPNYQGLLDDIIEKGTALSDKVNRLRKQQSELDARRGDLYNEAWASYRRAIGAESLLSEDKFGEDEISQIRKKILEEAQDAFLAQPTARSTKEISKEFTEASSKYKEVTAEWDKAQEELASFIKNNSDTIEKLQKKINWREAAREDGYRIETKATWEKRGITGLTDDNIERVQEAFFRAETEKLSPTATKEDYQRLVDAINPPAFPAQPSPAPAPESRGRISLPSLLSLEKNSELAYHGTRLDQITSLLGGIKPETNFSPDFNGQAFGSDVVLVYPKNQLPLNKKSYQNDLVLTQGSAAQPVAAMLDVANFESSDARRSYSGVMEDIANLPKEDSDIAMDLYVALDLGDRKKAAQIRDDIRGNPAAIEQQIRDMRIKEFKGKYYLPTGEQIFSLPKAQPKPNAEVINRLAVELSKASDEAAPSVSQEQAINNAVASIPNTLPVFTYELSESGQVINVKSVRAGAPTAIPAPEIRESQAVKNIIATFDNALPEGEIKDKILSQQNYQSVSNKERFEDARSYVEANGIETSIMNFLGGNVQGPLPLQQAVGYEVARILSEKSKTDLYARENLVEVMLLLAKKYGTEAGQTVSLWKALGELSNNPEAMKMFVGRQLDSAVKGRLSGYVEEEEEIASSLKDASRRATEKLLTSPKTKTTLEKIAKLIELNKKQSSVAEIEAQIASYLDSDQAASDGAEFLGADLAAAPEVGGGGSDDIRLNPDQTKALSRMILDLIQRSENPNVLAASEEEIKRLLLLTTTLRNAKDQENIRRKLDLYFDASLAHALEIFSSQVLGEARARENIQPPATRGEAIDRVYDAKAKAKERAPVSIEQGVGDGSIDHALLDAAANSLQRQAERLQKEPKVKTQMELLVSKIKGYIAANTKAKGGLQPAYKPLPKPTEAEVFRDLVANHPQTMEIFDGILDSLQNNFSEEELIGLEPFIEKVFNSPYTQSSLKNTIRTLESIGGPRTNIQGLIRSSRGDIMTFENEMGALLTKNTSLDEAQKKEVTDFLREGLAELIANERKLELGRIKKRFEAKKERKTRKMRSALDKLIEASNLGILNDSEVFTQMHSQLGLPELGLEERARLNKLIEDLPIYPVGMIRSKEISKMYRYVKLVSPQVWGELLVNYQTSNLLAGVGTIGINAWSSTVSNQLNASILAAVGTAKGIFGDKNRAAGYRKAALALNASIFAGEKPALKAAKNVLFTGDYSGIQDALTQELGGVNLWEAILGQAEDYRSGKKGATKPELPVNILGQEYRIPLDSKYISSKYGALAPFIFFGRAMAAGDAINRVSSRKMYEMAEATNIAIEKGLKTEEEIETEVARLLNQSPEARARAEAKAENEAKEFGLTPDQQSLRVEEILEQGRPDEQEVKNLIEKAKNFASQSTYTNNFEGWFGLLADGLTGIANKAWPLKLVIKFLKTGSSLANEVLNFLPVMSTIRLYRGSAAMLKESKYYRPPPVPGTVEHDLLVGKMTAGYIITAGLLAALRGALDGEDDPYFNIHFKGPNDPSQREAFFAAGGKLRAIQVGRFKDGKPQFFSFEAFPVGLSGPLILSGAITEAIRYEKRATAEAIVMGALTGGALAMYGILDMAALSGVRQIMSLTSPGVGQKDAKGIMTNLTKTAGNVVGGLVPGYASLRDVEQVWNGITGAPSARPYQNSFMSTFAQSIPFASKVGQPDLDFLGGNVKTQLANTLPLLRRLTTIGVDSVDYSEGKRTPQAVHDKLISLFAANRIALDWGAGPLKDFAMLDLVKDKQASGQPISFDDFYQLKRELTADEKYEWMKRAGVAIQTQLGGMIPQLETMSRAQFGTVVPAITNPIKRAILYQVLLEKNQAGILYPESK